MEKYKPYILLGAAVIVALITSVLIYGTLQRTAKGKETLIIPTQPAAVVVEDLHGGTVLKKEMIQMAAFPKEALPEGSFSDSSLLVGRVLILPLKAKEPLLEAKLAPISITTGGVAAVISPKKRAIAVRVDKTIGVSGFIRPGNRVDVLVTLPSGKIPVPITKTVLENVLVRTVGAEIEKKGKEEKPSDVDVITLEVTPQEAEKLALAAAEGKLQLTLRNYSDNDSVLTKGVTIPMLLASYDGVREVKPRKAIAKRKPEAASAPIVEKAEQVPPPAPAPVNKPVFIVEVIKGSALTEVKFEGGYVP